MNPVNRHTKFSIKPLLAVVYLLFFSIQFNPRYYSIASFFDYASSAKIEAGSATHVLPEGRAQRPVVFSNNIPNRAHLGIDKRYQGKRAVEAIPGGSRLNFTYYPELCVRFYSTDPAIVSVDLVIPSLRGPPCA